MRIDTKTTNEEEGIDQQCQSRTEGYRTITSQIDRFKDAARALGCDEDEAAFDEKLRGIAKQKAGSSPDEKKQR